MVCFVENERLTGGLSRQPILEPGGPPALAPFVGVVVFLAES